jgi:uncharacterized protein
MINRIILQPDDIDDEDLATALANTCRFGGRTRFYSTAQHLVIASWQVAESLALPVLLHDGEEAYVGGDIPTPEKSHSAWANIVLCQERNRSVVLRRYGCDPELPDYVHEVDRRMLATEARDLFRRKPSAYGIDAIPYPHFQIEPWLPDEARGQFLLRLRQLTGGLSAPRPRRPRQQQHADQGADG